MHLRFSRYLSTFLILSLGLSGTLFGQASNPLRLHLRRRIVRRSGWSCRAAELSVWRTSASSPGWRSTTSL